MTPAVLAYPGNEAVAERLARDLHASRVMFETRRFPDGETYLRIDSTVSDGSVAVVCTLRDPNEKLLPLIFVADTLRELGARKVGLVAPYLAYMRQDRRFRPGEALTSSSFARVLSTHFDWLVTLDPHLHRTHSLAELYSIPTEVIHAAPMLAQWVRENVTHPLIVGPDTESEQWVSAVATAANSPHLVLEKLRRGDREVAVSAVPELGRWTEHTPVLIDDIASSGRTLIETVRQWTQTGLPAPVCLVVHGVFAPGAYEALRAAGARRIVTTNSIPHPSNGIDVCSLFTASIHKHLT